MGWALIPAFYFLGRSNFQEKTHNVHHMKISKEILDIVPNYMWMQSSHKESFFSGQKVKSTATFHVFPWEFEPQRCFTQHCSRHGMWAKLFLSCKKTNGTSTTELRREDDMPRAVDLWPICDLCNIENCSTCSIFPLDLKKSWMMSPESRDLESVCKIDVDWVRR